MAVLPCGPLFAGCSAVLGDDLAVVGRAGGVLRQHGVQFGAVLVVEEHGLVPGLVVEVVGPPGAPAALGVVRGDFDLIGGSFHKWVRDVHARLGLNSSEDFERFIEEFCKFADIYIHLRQWESAFDEKQPYLFYNAALSFTLQSQLCLAPIRTEDLNETVERKVLLVSRFIDIYIYTRAINYKSMDYSTIKYAMFQLTKRIRNLDVEALVAQLGKEIADLDISIDGAWDEFRLNSYTKKYIRHMLARITDYVERGCDQPGHYLDYVAIKSKRPFEVEHIITDHFEWYQDEYGSREEFDATRNRPGNLLLLDKSTNASINDDRYPQKLPVYGSEKGNALSAALVAASYQHNPRFLKFMGETGFAFKPYDTFSRDEIAERSLLVESLALALWTPDFDKLAASGLEA